MNFYGHKLTLIRAQDALDKDLQSRKEEWAKTEEYQQFLASEKRKKAVQVAIQEERRSSAKAAWFYFKRYLKFLFLSLKA